MKNWYSIKNKSSDVLDISIHEEIGLWGVSARDFIKELRSHKNISVINLSIHSPGGNVLDGFAIYNALASHPAKIYASVEGVAASAASFILLSGDVISMPEDSFLMIHNAWGGAIGDSDELRKTADIIDKLQDSIVNIYQKRTGKDEDELREMMSEETWMNAADALEHGFIDTITDAIDVAAKINKFSRHFKNMPVQYTKNDIEQIDSLQDAEKFLRDSGSFSRRSAKALLDRISMIIEDDSNDVENEDATIQNDALSRLNSVVLKQSFPSLNIRS